MPQSIAEILLLPVSILTILWSATGDFAPVYQNYILIELPRWSYDVISFSTWQPWHRKSTSGYGL